MKKDKESNLVVTVSGNKCPKSLCRRIKNEYYFVGDKNIKDSGDVYYINNKFYKESTGYIIFDYRIGEYIISNDSLVKGVVGYSNDQLIYGQFSSKNDNYNEYCQIITPEGLFYLFNPKFISKSNYKESLRDNKYYERGSIPAKDFITPQPCDKNVKRGLSYDSKDSLKYALQLHKKAYQVEPTKVSKQIAKYLEGLSFGVEFETSLGNIPINITERLGLIPLRDGSIGGIEFVTVPLSGAIGVQALLDSMDELEFRTKYDENCSLHIHLGNLPRTEEFFLAMFKILCIVQDEMFSMFPIYKKDNHGVKNKCYTRPFNLVKTLHKLDSIITTPKQIKTNFAKLYNYLSMGQKYSDVGSNLEDVKSHPSDPGGNGKWNIRTRYHWCNIIPLLFGNKQTIEFRIHTSTYSKDKLIQYLILIASITNYVKANIGNILKNENLLDLTMNDIYTNQLQKVDKEKGADAVNYMSDYVYQRTNYISRCIRKNDILADEDNFVYRCNWFNFKQPIQHIQYAKSSKTSKEPIAYQAFDNNGLRFNAENPVPVVEANNFANRQGDLINAYIRGGMSAREARQLVYGNPGEARGVIRRRG